MTKRTRIRIIAVTIFILVGLGQSNILSADGNGTDNEKTGQKLSLYPQGYIFGYAGIDSKDRELFYTYGGAGTFKLTANYGSFGAVFEYKQQVDSGKVINAFLSAKLSIARDIYILGRMGQFWLFTTDREPPYLYYFVNHPRPSVPVKIDRGFDAYVNLTKYGFIRLGLVTGDGTGPVASRYDHLDFHISGGFRPISGLSLSFSRLSGDQNWGYRKLMIYKLHYNGRFMGLQTWIRGEYYDLENSYLSGLLHQEKGGFIAAMVDLPGAARKFSVGASYGKYDYDMADASLDPMEEFVFGVTYKATPFLTFQLNWGNVKNERVEVDGQQMQYAYNTYDFVQLGFCWEVNVRKK